MGGAHGGGVAFEIVRTATGYASAPTLILNFASGAGNEAPSSGLVADSHEDLFGVMELAGDETLFEITGAGFIAAPIIEGTVASQVAATGTSTTPFSGVTLSDPNSAATETLTITLTGASGSLADGVGFDGLESAGDNAYVLTGSASAVTSELKALAFSLAGAGATRLTLTDVSSADPSAPATDATTTVVDVESVGAISASAAYVSANFSGFEDDALLTTIDLTDAGIPLLYVAAAEATGAGETLGKITNELFEVLAPSPALPVYDVGGNGAGGTAITLAASSSIVNLQANSRLDLAGSNNALTLGASSNISLDASDDTVTAATDDGIWLLAGTGEAIDGSGFTLNAASGTQFAVGGNGAGGTDIHVHGFSMGVGLHANSRMDVTGSNDSVNMGGASDFGLHGSDDTISATTGDTIWLLAGTGDMFTGSNFTIEAASGSEFTVGGNGAYGPFDYVRGHGLGVGVASNSFVYLTGSNDSVSMAANSNLNVVGSDDTITTAADDSISLLAGTGDTILGRGLTIGASNSTSLSVGGNDVDGANDYVTGFHVGVGELTLSRVYLEGSDDSVSMGADANLAVRGDDDVIYTASADGVWMVSGVDDTIAGSSFTVYASYGNRLTLSNGTQDTFVAAYNGIVTDLATATLFLIGANVGSLQFVNFATDPTAVIDLLGGAGGYATSAAALASLTSDGNGGSELPLGDNGVLLFDKRAPSQFSASNFKIG